MNFDNLDLDINNYSYKEILGLLNLTVNFNENELKQSRQIVLKLHPDKCNINKEIYLFFSELYNLVLKVWKTTQIDTKKIDILEEERNGLRTEEYHDKDKEFIKKFADSKNFNKKFNELFNQVYNKKDFGYDEWMKSNEDITTNMTEKQTKEHFYKMKNNQANEMSLINKIDTIQHNQCDSIFDEEISEYSSDIFSKLSFNDLKKAHQNNVIPVNDNTYIQKKKTIKTFQQEQSERALNINPITGNEAEKILENNKNTLKEKYISNKLLQEINNEQQKTKLMEGWSKFKLIQ
jgi:hypothetical protein